MSQAELYCPHFGEFTDSEFQELFSEVAAIRAENADLFDFTHRRIEVFPSGAADQDDPPIKGEEDILAEINTDRNRNYAVIIEGETGTGKSELCAYLVHRLREQKRPILRIDKDDDLMSILTQRLPAFYEEHFDEKLPQEGNFKQLEKDIKENPQTVASSAASGALLTFSKKDYNLSYSAEDEAVITDIVQDQLASLVSSGEYGRERTLITEQQYRREPAFNVFADPVTDAEAIDAWNTTLWDRIQSEYDTRPISEVMKEVGDRFTDTRPVAVFEDFSIASMEAKQLSNFIETDNSRYNWDFVIAGTRDVTEVLHSKTAQDRFSFYQTNKPNSNSVLFLDEESAVDFIRPYLGYFKSRDGSVSYERDENGNPTELQPAPAGTHCAECGLCAESYRDLFPFNEVFLRRIYTGLDESQQSPREYVSKVYEILQAYYMGGTNVPASAEALEQDVTNREAPSDEVYDQYPTFADLAKWYGTKEGGAYVVDRAFARAFGLVEPDRQPGELEAGIKIESKEIRIPAAGSSPDEPGGGESGGGEEGGEPKSKVQRIYEAHLGDVDDWRSDPSHERFSETNSYIRAALTDLIETVTGDYALWTDSDLRYNLSSQKAPFVYENAATQFDDDQVILDPREFRPSEIRGLLKHGIRLKEASDSADTDAMLESLGTHITQYGRAWREQILSSELNTNRVLYRKSDRGRFDFDDFVIAAYALLTLLDDASEVISAEQLNRRYGASEDYSLDENFKQELQSLASRDQSAQIETFIEYGDELESLIGSRFGVAGSSLDVPELKRRMERATPSRIMSALAKSYIDNISGRVRFGPKKTLVDIATAAYNAQNTLEDVYEDHEPIHAHGHILEIFADLDMDTVGDIAEGLNTYQDVDSDFAEAVSKFADIEQSTIDELVDTAQMVNRELSLNTNQGQINTMVVDMSLGGSDAVRRYLELDRDWSSPSDTGSGKRFMEVSQQYVR